MNPIIYSEFITVVQGDLDELNHVNNVRYFDFLQQAAVGHWYCTVPKELSESMRWVVKRHEIEYFKPAFLDDVLKISTWVNSFSGVTSLRFYEIYKNDQLILKAQTLWVAVNPETMQLKRLPNDLWEKYFSE